MKKTLVIMFVLLVFFTACFAAPSVDVKSMSDAELEGLRDLIIDELASRGVSDSDEEAQPLYAGTYIVGENMEAGSYSVSVSEDAIGVDYNIYKNEDDFMSGADPIDGDTIWGSDTSGFSIVLRDGMVFDIFIPGGNVTIKKTN